MDFEQYKRRLQPRNQGILDEQTERRQELQPITLGLGLSSQRREDYAVEAAETYIAGHYRSTIFWCACSVEQILKYEYLRVPANTLEDLHKSETFGQIIGRCRRKNIQRLATYLERAGILNDIRNGVVAHPVFTDFSFTSEDQHEMKRCMTIRQELAIQNIKSLLDLVRKVDPEARKRFESQQLHDQTAGKAYNFGRVIAGKEKPPDDPHGFWALIQDGVLRTLAFHSWGILKEISEGLYPA